MTDSELNMIALVRLWQAGQDTSAANVAATIATLRDLPEAELRAEYDQAVKYWAQRLIAKNKSKDGIDTLYTDGLLALDCSRVKQDSRRPFRLRVGEVTPENTAIYFDAATARGIAFALVQELNITAADLFPNMVNELRLQIMQEMITALNEVETGK